MRFANVERFTNLIGNLVQIDNNEEEQLVNKNHLRFKVELSIDEPLLSGCKIILIYYEQIINLMTSNCGLNLNMKDCHNFTSIMGF